MILSTALSLVVSDSFAQATKDKSTLVQIVTKKLRIHVGVLQEDDGKSLTILDFKTRKLTTFKHRDIRTVQKNVSERVVASTAGLPSLLSWQMTQRIPKQSGNGKIVSVDLGVAYVTLGQKSGIRKDEELLVFCGEKIIKDPDTGDVIARQKRWVARVKVIEVQEKFCKAKVIGELEIELKVGDGVVPVAKKAIAVLPFTNAAGDATVGGLKLSEELTSWLVKDGLPVVERTKLADALGELILQRTGIFNPDTVQKVGKQIGAFAVVSGSIIPGRIRSKVNVRVVEVASGSILYASTIELSRIDNRIAPAGAVVGGKNGGKPVLAAGLAGAMGHWSFENSTKNTLANKYHGRLIGGAKYGKGRNGNAVSFDGSSSFFQVEYSTDLEVGTGDFAVSFWVNLDNTTRADAHPCVSMGGNNRPKGWKVGIARGGSVGFESSGGQRNAPTHSQIATPPNTVQAEQWHHIAVSVKRGPQGNLTKIFVDGKEAASGNVGFGDLTDKQFSLCFGKTDQYRLDGRIDEAWFFRRALSAGEVRSLAKAR